VRQAIARDGGLRLAVFAALCAATVWRYAGVETNAPAGRLIAIAAVAVVAGAALASIGVGDTASRRARASAAAARVIVIGAGLLLALLATGVSTSLLLPMRWGKLGHELALGVQTIAGTLWPYVGHDRWARLDLLVVPAAAGVAAAALAFWPPRGGGSSAGLRWGVRQITALALLLAVYVIGVIDSNGGAAAAEGLLLLMLVAAWLWLPGLRARRLPSALVWLAAAGGAAALLVGPFGGGQAWLNYRSWNLLGTGAPGVAFSWDQSYGPIRWSRSQRTMFTVRAPRSQLWKTTTLDRFDGLRFVRSDTDASTAEDLPLPLNDRWYEFARFTIQGLSSQLLPSEQGTTVGVNIANPVLHAQDGTAQTSGPKLRGGQTYTILSYVPQPTAADVRAAPRSFPRSYLRYTAFDLPSPAQSGLRLAATDPREPGRFFTDRTVSAPAPGLPPAASPRVQRLILTSPYAPMYRLARRLAAGKRSDYDIATSIDTYLKANYAYGEETPLRRYPLESFLFDDGTGYCQQFSGAMALMLRMDGIPARVAAGFLPGTYNSATGTYEVHAVDAHAWVEVFIEGIGWVPFDPTPPRVVGKVPKFPLYTSERTVTPAAAIAATVGSLPQNSGQRIPIVRPSKASGGAGLVVLLAVGGIGLMALTALTIRWLAGGVRLRRSLASDGELAAVELVRGLERLGYAIDGRATLAQIERDVRLQGGLNAARYVRMLRDRRYAPANGGAVITLSQRRALRHAITAHLGLDARLRGLWALPPGTVAWRL
jgi:protein-glutamine gamma-glutamyltransferase